MIHQWEAETIWTLRKTDRMAQERTQERKGTGELQWRLRHKSWETAKCQHMKSDTRGTMNIRITLEWKRIKWIQITGTSPTGSSLHTGTQGEIKHITKRHGHYYYGREGKTGDMSNTRTQRKHIKHHDGRMDRSLYGKWYRQATWEQVTKKIS